MLMTSVLASALTSSAMAAAPHRLPFIADDYPRAGAEARKRKLPLFVEVWGPW